MKSLNSIILINKIIREAYWLESAAAILTED